MNGTLVFDLGFVWLLLKLRDEILGAAMDGKLFQLFRIDFDLYSLENISSTLKVFQKYKYNII